MVRSVFNHCHYHLIAFAYVAFMMKRTTSFYLSLAVVIFFLRQHFFSAFLLFHDYRSQNLSLGLKKMSLSLSSNLSRNQSLNLSQRMSCFNLQVAAIGRIFSLAA